MAQPFLKKNRNQIPNSGKQPRLGNRITDTKTVSKKNALWDCNQILSASVIFPEGITCYREQY